MKKPVSNRRQEKWLYSAVEKAPSQSQMFRLFFQLDQAVEKTEILDQRYLSDSCFGKVWKSRRVRISPTHATTTRHTTRPQTTTSATLAWLLPLLLLLAASQRDTSLSTPVSSTYQHSMAAVRSIDGLLPTAALPVDLAALDCTAAMASRTRLRRTPRVRRSHAARERSEISACM